jgi:hypothetical protein
MLSPSQIHKVLTKEQNSELETRSGEESRLSKLLQNANLTPLEVLEQVSNLMQMGDSGAVRLGAAKTALELNGLLRNDKNIGEQFSVTIIINDAEHIGINPILIPR